MSGATFRQSLVMRLGAYFHLSVFNCSYPLAEAHRQ
jgi:hypothetical protein